MMDHSIEELRRQLDAAKSRLAEAEKAERAAQTALNDRLVADAVAAFEAAGYVLGVTRVRQSDGNGGATMSRDPYVIVGFEPSGWRGIVPIARKLRKDGTLSEAPSGWYGAKYVVLPEDQPQ